MKLGARECLWYSNVWIQYMSGETIKIPRHIKNLVIHLLRLKLSKFALDLGNLAFVWIVLGYVNS